MKEAVQILYIHHERALGGAPLSLLYLARCIYRQKYSPSILCLREGPAADLFRKENIPVQIVNGPDLSHTELVWFRWWQFPRLFLRLLRSIPLFFRLKRVIASKIKSHPPASGVARVGEVPPKLLTPWIPTHGAPQTIIHLNSSTLLVGALAAKSHSLPVVWHIREPLTKGYFGIRRALLRWMICSLADQIIAISNHDAGQLGLSSKITVIHNFVDFTQFNPGIPKGTLRKDLRIPEDSTIILFLGGSTRVKGAEVLLRAVPEILGKLRSAHLVIAGEISPQFQLKAADPSLSSFQNRLHLLGPRLDIPSLLADASILVFPSTVPHFARPVIEAAAMGKPVIASDVDGMRELVIRNETGVLVPPNQVEALALATIELAQDFPRAYRLGQQGLALAHEKFDASKNAAATFAIYERILSSLNLSHS